MCAMFRQMLESARNILHTKVDLPKIENRWLKLSKTKTFKHGVPFVLFVVLASVGLREFTNLRYEYSKVTHVKAKIKESGVPMRDKKETTLEAQYEVIKELDTTNWENKRIARPWEEETQVT